jgi:peptidoglycan/LPS O-acetylase OafA/YrhL
VGSDTAFGPSGIDALALQSPVWLKGHAGPEAGGETLLEHPRGRTPTLPARRYHRCNPSKPSGANHRIRNANIGTSPAVKRSRRLSRTGYLACCGFHYCSRWTPPKASHNLYPYGDLPRDAPIFSHGDLGVELFFVISGFVIALTLIRSKDWLDFALRRTARLFPSMFLCSIFTFAVLTLLPVKYFHPTLSDFAPSLTFIEPAILEKLLGRHVAAIDGAYWSLFVEVKFYFWACLLFFVFKERRFLAAFTVFVTVVLALGLLAELVSNDSMVRAGDFFFASSFLPWFGAGVAFFYLYQDRKNTLASLLAIETLTVVLVQAVRLGAASEIPFDLAFYALFLLFVLRPASVRAFEWKPLALVGESSYSLYLIHQSVGVSLIAQVWSLVGMSPSNWSALLAPFVAAVMTLFSLLIYRYWEVPAKRKLLDLGQPLLTRLRNGSWPSMEVATAKQGAPWWRRLIASQQASADPRDRARG